jgi:hypothetical protein
MLLLELAPCALLEMFFNSLMNAQQSTCHINFAQFKTDGASELPWCILYLATFHPEI